MTIGLVEGKTVSQRGAVDALQGQAAAVRHCDGCGAPVVVGMSAEALPSRWGAVWFCGDCVRALPAAEIARRTREVSLRGVPLN
jgi:hypothetical protein